MNKPFKYILILILLCNSIPVLSLPKNETNVPIQLTETKTIVDTIIYTRISKGAGFEPVAIIPAHSSSAKVNIEGKVEYIQPMVESGCRTPALNAYNLHIGVNRPLPLVEFRIYLMKNGKATTIYRDFVTYTGSPITIPNMGSAVDIRARLWLFPVSYNGKGPIAKGQSREIDRADLKINQWVKNCGATPLNAVTSYDPPQHKH